MRFLRNFFINLIILILILALVNYLIPGLLSAMYQIGIGVLGPGLLLLLLILYILPRGRMRK